jgi:hypothetical protein
VTRDESARHRASVRAGERCGIRRQYPSLLTPRLLPAVELAPRNGRPAEFPPLDGPLFHIPGNGRYNESGEIPGRIPVVELPLKDSEVAAAPSMNGGH